MNSWKPCVNFISHHWGVWGTGCMNTHMVPIHSIVGLQCKGGLVWSCFRPAVDLLLCATLSCKICHSPNPLLIVLLIFHYHLFLCLSFICSSTASTSLLSSCPLFLSHPIIGAPSQVWKDGCRNIKVLVMILAPPQRCSIMKVQGVWVWSVCTCHSSAAIIGPKVPLLHHGGGGALLNAYSSSLPHAQG